MRTSLSSLTNYLHFLLLMAGVVLWAGSGAGPDYVRPTRACFRFSPARPRGAKTPRFPTGRALREQWNGSAACF